MFQARTRVRGLERLGFVVVRQKLPESKRERWFEELEALGFNEPSEQDIPQRFLSDAWWRF